MVEYTWGFSDLIETSQATEIWSLRSYSRFFL
uniref:Uncharacterized protein n=1 Tax=Rhizophora mucronata TaxID=61149 RepID=A0A2P2QMD3_RHIMU